MKVAYVAGPYRSDSIWGVKENIERAERIAAELWRLGFAVVCPHKNSAFFDGVCPDDVFLKGDIEIMRRCDLVVMVHGWEASTGAKTEVAEAKRIGIPAYEWRWIDDHEGSGNLRRITGLHPL